MFLNKKNYMNQFYPESITKDLMTSREKDVLFNLNICYFLPLFQSRNISLESVQSNKQFPIILIFQSIERQKLLKPLF